MNIYNPKCQKPLPLPHLTPGFCWIGGFFLSFSLRTGRVLGGKHRRCKALPATTRSSTRDYTPPFRCKALFLITRSDTMGCIRCRRTRTRCTPDSPPTRPGLLFFPAVVESLGEESFCWRGDRLLLGFCHSREASRMQRVGAEALESLEKWFEVCMEFWHK